jgi:hypothetical protein
MNALCSLYMTRGYKSASWQPRSFIQQGEQYAVADIQWCIEWDQEPPWLFATTYNLVCTVQGWKVLLCTAYEEDKLAQVENAA